MIEIRARRSEVECIFECIWNNVKQVCKKVLWVDYVCKELLSRQIQVTNQLTNQARIAGALLPLLSTSAPPAPLAPIPRHPFISTPYSPFNPFSLLTSTNQSAHKCDVAAEAQTCRRRVGVS